MQKRYTQIKGISETRRLPRLGKIRLGTRTANSKGRTKDCTHKNEEYCFRCSFPKEVPYFVLPPEARAVYGDQPTEIDIMFPVDDPGTVFPQAYKLYGADQGLRCKGDGETAVRRLADVADETTKKEMLQLGLKAENLVEVPCPCPMLEAGKCGPKGCLMVMLPKVSCGGVYQIDTGSVLNLIEINSALDYLQSLLGRISMVSLKLRREPRNVTYQDPKNSKPTTKTHYLLKLVFEGAMQEVMRLRGGDRLALIGDYEISAPVEDGPEPTGECPIEVDGEVVDPGTGEVLAPNGKAAPAGSPKPQSNGKDQPTSPHRQLATLVQEAGIEGAQFLACLVHYKILAAPQDGRQPVLRDLSEVSAAEMADKWSSITLPMFREWEKGQQGAAEPAEDAPQFEDPTVCGQVPRINPGACSYPEALR